MKKLVTSLIFLLSVNGAILSAFPGMETAKNFLSSAKNKATTIVGGIKIKAGNVWNSQTLNKIKTGVSGIPGHTKQFVTNHPRYSIAIGVTAAVLGCGLLYKTRKKVTKLMQENKRKVFTGIALAGAFAGGYRFSRR